MSTIFYVLLGLIAHTSPALAQSAKEPFTERTFTNKKFGISFNYSSKFEVSDISYADDFKVVATLDGNEFTFSAIPPMPGYTFAAFAKYFYGKTRAADSMKPNYRISNLATTEESGHKVYYASEFYDKGGDKMENHVMMLDLPFGNSMGIMLKALTPYDPEKEKMVMREILRLLSTFKTSPR